MNIRSAVPKVLAGFVALGVLGTVIWIWPPSWPGFGLRSSTSTAAHAAAGRAVAAVYTTTAVSPTNHCYVGTTKTYHIGATEVIVNRRGLCATDIWYPPQGCVEMRRARTSVFDGPYGHCPGSKGLWGPNDTEAMRSSSGKVVTLDIALVPSRYR